MIRNISTSLLLLGFSFVIAFYYPHISLSPGNVQSWHTKLEQECSKCHTGFSGIKNNKCLSCHPLNDMKDRMFAKDSQKKAVNVSIRSLHKEVETSKCYSCHPEHTARQLIQEKKFVHDSAIKQSRCDTCHFKPTNKVHEYLAGKCSSCHTTSTWKGAIFSHTLEHKDCVSCHKKPTDNIHKTTMVCDSCHTTSTWRGAHFTHGTEHKDCIACHKKPNNSIHKTTMACDSCHTTSTWRGARFTHGAEHKDCISCHKKPTDNIHKTTMACDSCHTTSSWRGARFTHKDEHKDCLTCHKKPTDRLHESVTNCLQCHSTKNWKTSSFDHTKYFKFSKAHPAKCEKCHTGGDYKKYSCYNCHAHSEAGVERRHKRLGLTTFDNCVQCHRSSSEREAWKNMQKLRNPKVDATTRSTPRSSKYRDRNDDEHKEGSSKKVRREREHDDDDDDDD